MLNVSSKQNEKEFTRKNVCNTFRSFKIDMNTVFDINILTVESDNAKEIMESIKTEDNLIDFDKIAPVPEELKADTIDFSQHNLHDYLDLLLHRHTCFKPWDRLINEFRKNSCAKSWDTFIDDLNKMKSGKTEKVKPFTSNYLKEINDPISSIRLGVEIKKHSVTSQTLLMALPDEIWNLYITGLNRLKKYGAYDVEMWCSYNWGVRVNSTYHHQLAENKIMYCTSFFNEKPDRVFFKLSNLYPDAIFTFIDIEMFYNGAISEHILIDGEVTERGIMADTLPKEFFMQLLHFLHLMNYKN